MRAINWQEEEKERLWKKFAEIGEDGKVNC